MPRAPAQGVAYGAGFVFVATAASRLPHPVRRRARPAARPRRSRTCGPAGSRRTPTATCTPPARSPLADRRSTSASARRATRAPKPTRRARRCSAWTLDGSAMTTQAKRLRNAIALATDPATGTVWAGGAGQDASPRAIPTSSWTPSRRARRRPTTAGPTAKRTTFAYKSGANCANVVVPGARVPGVLDDHRRGVLSRARRAATYAFPAAWRGGMFVEHARLVAHARPASPVDPPHVAFVPFAGASPARAVNWSDPTAQWNDFFTGFQTRTAAGSAAPPASPSARKAASSSPTTRTASSTASDRSGSASSSLHRR